MTISLSEGQRREAIDSLSDAKILIEHVESMMDRTRAQCAACGLSHYHFWLDVKMSDQLRSNVQKLNRVIATLKKGGKEGRDNHGKKQEA